MTEIRAYRCDFPECGVIGFAWEGLVKRVQDIGGYTHWCPEHYPYERCSSCKKLLRPYQASAGDWPGTVAKHKSDPPLCSNCYAKGYGVVDIKFNGPEREAQAVRSLVVRHYQQHEEEGAWQMPAQETLEMLGLD